MKILHLTLAGAAATLLSITTTHAGFVTWDAATNATGDSDVSTAGTLVNAVHIEGPATTVNGVHFNDNSILGNFAFSGVTGALSDSFLTGLSPDYTTLLSAWAYSRSTIGLTMTGLTIGAQYQVEFWDFSSVGGTTTATAGNSVTVDGTASGYGQFAIGTFTADATSQAISFASIGPSNANGINAVQLRELAPAAVPEPGTALFGIALLGTTLLRRSR